MKHLLENLMPQVREYAELLLKNGFDIAIYEKPNCRWITFGKDGNLGYCQYDKVFGWSFSTVHKPCKEYGTGFRVTENIWNPTIKDAEIVFQRPSWANRSIVKRYDNLEEYVNKSILKYSILCGTN